MNTSFGLVLSVQEVDDGHVDLLAVAMAPSNALFDSLRIPRQVVVDQQGTELKVDTLGARLCCDQDRAVVTECIDNSGPSYQQFSNQK